MRVPATLLEAFVWVVAVLLGVAAAVLLVFGMVYAVWHLAAV